MSTATCFGVLVLVRVYAAVAVFHSRVVHQTHVFPEFGRYSLELLPICSS